jgi:hypothetical protein
VILETNNNQNKVPNASYAYSHFKESMITSLSDGSFIRLLQSSGLPSFYNATASADSFQALTYTVKYTDLSPTAAPTAAPTSNIAADHNNLKLSFGAIVSIIVVGAFLLVFCAVFTHQYRKHNRSNTVKVTPRMDDSFDLQSMYPSSPHERQLNNRNPLPAGNDHTVVISPEDIPITAMEEDEDEPASSLAMQHDGCFMYLCDLVEANEMAMESSTDFIRNTSLLEEIKQAEVSRKHAQYIPKSISTESDDTSASPARTLP